MNKQKTQQKEYFVEFHMIQRFVREVYMILVYMNTLCMMHFYKKNIYNSERVRIIISKLEKIDKILYKHCCN